jgi:hypothetical protein
MAEYEIESAKNISVRADWLHQSGWAPPEQSGILWWQIALRPAWIPRIALHITLQLQFRRFFSLCQYSIENDHCGVVANCDHTSEWVYWVHQQNENWSGSHTQTSLTLELLSPVLLCTSKCPRPPWTFAKCFQTPQEHSQVLLKAPAVKAVVLRVP